MEVSDFLAEIPHQASRPGLAQDSTILQRNRLDKVDGQGVMQEPLGGLTVAFLSFSRTDTNCSNLTGLMFDSLALRFRSRVVHCLWAQDDKQARHANSS